MLYTLSRIITTEALAEYSLLLNRQDVLLLSENGVVNAIEQSEAYWLLGKLSVQAIYVLQADIIARGLSDYIGPAVQQLNDQQWVALTVQHYPQVVL